MKLSIAMCTYNGARYLREQLASLAAQTRLPDELVVCDDCSSDGTRMMLEEFKTRTAFPVRLFFNDRNLRSTKNFEKAISLCDGDLIALCDQDDVWLPAKLERMEAEFARSPDVGLVFTDLEVVDESLRPLGYQAWEAHWVEFGEREQQMFDEGRAFNVLLTRNVVTGAAAAFRSEYRDLILPLPEISKWLLHDYWIAFMISLVAKLKPIKEPMVKYRAHANQQMGLLPPSKLKDPQGAAARRRREYVVRSHYLELFLQRLAEREGNPKYAKAIRDLKVRLKHAQVRAAWADQKYLRRALSIFGEFFAARYHLCSHPDSTGWRDVANDLIPLYLKRDSHQ